MAKILFDITAAHEPADWQQSQVLVEVSGQVFSYAAVTADKRLLQLRTYELETALPRDLAPEVSSILAADEYLQNTAAAFTVVYNFPESQLVPQEYFTEAIGHDFMSLFHGDLHKGIVLTEKVAGSTQYNVFRIPAEVHHVLATHFVQGKHWHYYSLWLQHCANTEQQDSMAVIFYPKRMLVTVMKNQQLLLLQSFNYEAAEDVGYHLLNICGQLGLSPQDIPLMLSGMIDHGSALHTEIFKYFGQVNLDSHLPAQPALQEYPGHFFSPLMKLATCVS
ncbi:MAG TPA: DUF3822 family protein [Chitinophagaceae bacterium]|nr:DUF3822 family protein [Chitinophagaceae bacterium]